MDQSLNHLQCLDAVHVLHGLYDDDPRDEKFGGNGATVWDATGRRYLDGLSSPRNALLCHGRKELAEAAADQMRQRTFGYIYSGLANAPAIQFAARLKGSLPKSLQRLFSLPIRRRPALWTVGGSHLRWGTIRGDGVLLYPTSGREATTAPLTSHPHSRSPKEFEEMVPILPKALEDTTNTLC